MKISNVLTKARYSIPGRTLMAILFLKPLDGSYYINQCGMMKGESVRIFSAKKKHLSDRLDRSAAGGMYGSTDRRKDRSPKRSCCTF